MQNRLRNTLELGLAPLNPVTRAEFEALRFLFRYVLLSILRGSSS